MTSASAILKTNVHHGFNFHTLFQPTITPALRDKVVGAYDYIRSVYSFKKPDVPIGSEIFKLPSPSRTNYSEYESFNSVVLGALLNSLLCGSMIFFGPPGSGKTTTPEVISQVLFGLNLKEVEEATLYCHSNLTEEKMTAAFDIPKLMKGKKEVIWSSWVTGFSRTLDEVNRMAPETSSILMQAVDRRRVSYAGVVTKEDDMPFGPVFATANYFDKGNFEMPRPFWDRFGISVHTEGLSPQDLDMIWMPEVELDQKGFALSKEDREQIHAEIRSIPIDNNTIALLSHLGSGLCSCELAGNAWYDKHKSNFGDQPVECDKDKCGFNPAIVVCSQIKEQGLSTRAALALRDYSRAFAWFLNRKSVDNEVMQRIFALVNNHRLSPSRTALNGGESEEGVNIDRNLFVRKTFDFYDHLWGMGVSGFHTQNPIYSEIDRFYETIASGEKSTDALLTDGEEILGKVDTMEDPAKWKILEALHEARRILRARR